MKKIFNDFITSKKQILAISSPYGTGKTYTFKKLIPDFKKILFITYRQSLANSLFNELKNEGFKNYNVFNKWRNTNCRKVNDSIS